MLDTLQGRWLERVAHCELTFEIVWLESQDFYIYSRADGQNAITGRLNGHDRPNVWKANLSDGTELILRLDASNSEKVLFLESNHNGIKQCSEARQLLISEEWRKIIDEPLMPNETMKIEAAPGSGKTTVLREWCRARVDKQVLFLSYSKSVQEQQELNFRELSNVTVRTLHSVAYEATGSRRCCIGDMSKTDVKNACNVSWDKATEMMESFKTFLSSRRTPESFMSGVQNLWKQCLTGHLKRSHDCYLKQFQLQVASGQYVSDIFAAFDVLVLDEAQDCTEAMLDIFERVSGKAKLLAFDCHQNISHFRGVLNSTALSAMPGQSMQLSQSMRFGPKIAKMLTAFIANHKRVAKIDVRGHPDKRTEVEHSSRDEAYRSICSVSRSAQLTVLARKNSTLFAEMVEVAKGTYGHVRNMSVIGGWETFSAQVLDPTMDIYFLASGQIDRIQNSFVKRYADLDKFRFVVEMQSMVDWLAKLEIYDSYRKRFPKLVDQVQELMSDEAEADVLFSTVHKSKGLGWPFVLLLDDFLSGGNRRGDISEEEINICYVALSRVSTGKLFLTFDPCNPATRTHPSVYEEDDMYDDHYDDDFLDYVCSLGAETDGDDEDSSVDHEDDVDRYDHSFGDSQDPASAEYKCDASNKVPEGAADGKDSASRKRVYKRPCCAASSAPAKKR